MSDKLVAGLMALIALYFIGRELWKCIDEMNRIREREQLLAEWEVAWRREDWERCATLQREYGRLCNKYQKELKGEYGTKNSY